MSTTDYYPNYPDTTIVYPIGTEGLEHSRTGTSDFFADIISALYPYTKHVSLLHSCLAMWIVTGDLNSMVPTYGKWGGGARTAEVKWEETPCYNETVKTSADPESCFSLVDAICKTHDWRYHCAEK